MNQCPQCGSSNLAQAAEGMLNCKECHHYFPGTLYITPPPAPPPDETSQLPSRGSVPDRGSVSAAERVRSHARMFVGLSVFFLILGVFVTVATFCDNLREDVPSHSGYAAAAGFILLALWLYLIGQIVHIRALLEKNQNQLS